MIQFNLLPDVKLHYIKAERQKKLVISIATIAIVTSIALLVILILIVNVMQAKNIADLGNDIENAAQELREIEDIDRVLTVQSQLKALPELHDRKVVSTRTFDYIAQITPSTVSISSIIINYEAQSIEISGIAPSLKDVNSFADSLKFTTYKTSEEGESAAAFANIVLSDISRDEEEAEYTLLLNYDPAIFSSASNVTLTVPSIISNQPGVERPEPLFQAPAPVEGV